MAAYLRFPLVLVLLLAFASPALAAGNQAPTATITVSQARGTAPLDVSFVGAASDPEGQAVTFAWDFGVPGAPPAAGSDATFHYAAPGVYTVTLTATDAAGAVGKAVAAVIVDEAPVACPSQRSDEFTGSTLDTNRWTVIRPAPGMEVAGGALHIPTTQTDIYGFGAGTLPRLPDGTANPPATPNIPVQPAPAAPWTAEVKLTMHARDKYEQAGVLLYGDDDNHAKMVFEARGTNDAAARTFQFLVEQGGYPGENGSNTPNLGAAFPDTVYMRMTYDGTNVGASYSPDGVTWTTLAPKRLVVANPRIGLISFSDAGNPVIDAAFHYVHITPDGPTINDEFAGTTLATASADSACARWQVVREDAEHYRVRDGQLEIDTSGGDVYNTDTTLKPTNIMLQTASGSDWTIETKMDGSAFNQAYQNAGLIAYLDDANYIKLDYVSQGSSARIEMRAEVNDHVLNEQIGSTVTNSVWWFRLVKQGAVYHGYTSTNDTTWTEIGTANVALPSLHPILGAARVGVFAWGGPQTSSQTARFEYFHATSP